MSERGYAPEFLAVVGLVNGFFPTSGWVAPDPLANIEQCIIYTRLSRQDDRSHSPETQRRVATETATRQGWKLLKVIDRDAFEPISGKSFEARPGWDEVKSFVASMKTEERRKTCVLVKSFDRFSRDTAEGILTADEFRDALDVRLRAADALYIAPEENGQGRIWFEFALVQAEAERLHIQRRTVEGLETARREGKHLGEFPNHFVKDAAGRIVPTDAARQVAELRARGLSYTKIAGVVGIDRMEIYHLCEFLSREKSRLEALG